MVSEYQLQISTLRVGRLTLVVLGDLYVQRGWYQIQHMYNARGLCAMIRDITVECESEREKVMSAIARLKKNNTLSATHRGDLFQHVPLENGHIAQKQRHGDTGSRTPERKG